MDGRKGPSEIDIGRLFKLLQKKMGFGPLTPEEAQRVWEEAEPVSISEDRISRVRNEGET
jgi:hypothetical protein